MYIFPCNRRCHRREYCLGVIASSLHSAERKTRNINTPKSLEQTQEAKSFYPDALFLLHYRFFPSYISFLHSVPGAVKYGFDPDLKCVGGIQKAVWLPVGEIAAV
ncbi:hypothetical protein CEXT_352901 [Caerostris extrusa]|uniref:Uncharacterized protein n=1 Tax=Caerostris extrusa TaxID=172846 RepID=A0AAV4WMA2_CAEEX|nr:hypothetical protein CEXT_352901 [Caerostris extrusa]